MEPLIVITRPARPARVLAQALEDAWGGTLPWLIAPLMQIVPVVPAPFGSVNHLIFTSPNGVAQADRLGLSPNATAWCVGERTAEAAGRFGFQVRNAGGDSAALVALIKAASPTGPILHLHGAHVAGRIVEDLRAAGFTCKGRVVYDQQSTPPSPVLQQVLQGTRPVIAPVLSPRSARLLAAAGPITAPLTLIALSPAVATAAETLPVKGCRISARPDQSALVDATLETFRAFLPLKTP